MGRQDARVDAYIAKAADFAKPILEYIRRVVHAACPEVEETLKWGMPHFDHQGVMCSMAGFKSHCVLGFRKSALILPPGREATENSAMGHFGRLTAISDLPERQVLTAYVKEAARLNEAGIKLPGKPRSRTPKKLILPTDFKAALKKNKKASTTFERFSPSHRNEYVEWITEAKRAETRKTRLATAMSWLAQGKSRHWKYR